MSIFLALVTLEKLANSLIFISYLNTIHETLPTAFLALATVQNTLLLDMSIFLTLVTVENLANSFYLLTVGEAKSRRRGVMYSSMIFMLF